MYFTAEKFYGISPLKIFRCAAFSMEQTGAFSIINSVSKKVFETVYNDFLVSFKCCG